MRKIVFSAVLALAATVGFAGPVLACEGYWSCTEHEHYVECYWID